MSVSPDAFFGRHTPLNTLGSTGPGGDLQPSLHPFSDIHNPNGTASGGTV